MNCFIHFIVLIFFALNYSRDLCALPNRVIFKKKLNLFPTLLKLSASM